MKLLIFFTLFQIPLSFSLGLILLPLNSAAASEIAESYQQRYENWLREQQQRKALLRQRLKTRTQRNVQVKTPKENKPAPKSKVSKQPVELPKALPEKIQNVQVPIRTTAPQPLVVQAKVSSIRVSEPPPRVQRQPTKALIEDSQSEFINNIPEDNKQVQTLLTMIDHTKVYFSINSDGRLKDLLTDPRFREIYNEEMKPETKKSTYHFFKGLQDSNRQPGEPIKAKLDRDTKVTRERVEVYLETTGIKSKLTRALTGSYPKPPPQPKEDIKYEAIDTPQPGAS